MRDVLQNTARKFKIYMADASAPTTGKTGLSSFTVYLAKDGLGESEVAPSITERGRGWYEVTPSTSHRDTLGENAWTFVASGAVDFPMKETVIAVDHQVATQPVNVTQFGGTNGTFDAGKPTVELDSSITSQLNDIEADSAAAVGYLITLVNRITSGVAQMWQDCIAMITGSGTADAGWDTAALSRAPSGSSSGDWTNTEKAQIRYRLGLEGIATAPPQPDVDPIVITPATGIMTTGYLVTRVKGVPTAGITIRYQQAQEPAADRGSSYDDTLYSAVSNSEGIAELSLVKGGLYYVWRSASTRPMNVSPYRVLKADGTAPDATLALPSHVGQ